MTERSSRLTAQLILPCLVFAAANEHPQNVNSTLTAVFPGLGLNRQAAGGGGSCVFEYVAHGTTPVVSTGTCTITPADLGQGSGTNPTTRDYAHSLGAPCPNDDAGHILANHLGGCGTCPTNIFPQAPHLNRGIWASFEGDIYNCLSNGASSATLKWSFHYPSSSSCCYYGDSTCKVGQTCCSKSGKSYTSESECTEYGSKHECTWDGSICKVDGAAEAGVPFTASNRPETATYSASYVGGSCLDVSQTFNNDCSPYEEATEVVS